MSGTRSRAGDVGLSWRRRACSWKQRARSGMRAEKKKKKKKTVMPLRRERSVAILAQVGSRCPARARARGMWACHGGGVRVPGSSAPDRA
mmetsp:Transcript_213/g.120  ORF Transcript_213/g.120 Transcript_213/m.120 type:complete len:90 (-) Transcript_213:30-299(-)